MSKLLRYQLGTHMQHLSAKEQFTPGATTIRVNWVIRSQASMMSNLKLAWYLVVTITQFA
jgi:hypothetical protein